MKCSGAQVNLLIEHVNISQDASLDFTTAVSYGCPKKNTHKGHTSSASSNHLLIRQNFSGRLRKLPRDFSNKCPDPLSEKSHKQATMNELFSQSSVLRQQYL